MTRFDNPWKINDQEVKYDNPWIKVTEFDVTNPGGGKGIYGKVHFKNVAIGVVALDANGDTFLVGQFRFVLGEYSWEIPEGGCPIGSNCLESAQRELLEETGLVAREWQLLFEMHLSNSVSDELAMVYLATQLEQKAPQPEETEQLQVKRLPLKEVFELVNRGAIKDAITVAAMQRLQIMIYEDVNFLKSTQYVRNKG